MRVLIWGVSFGERTASMMRLWAEALRRFARWEGEIVVIGDELVQPLEAHGVRVVDIAARARAIPRWEIRRATNLKPWILDYINPHDFEFLLYLDADVLAVRPLEALLAGPISRGKVAVQRDILLISGNHRCNGRETLTDEEKRRFADEAICAGIVGFPTNETGLSLLHDWHEAIRTKKYPAPPADQTLLIPLLLRGYLGRWEYFDDTVIGRHLEHREALIHFSNKGGIAEIKRDRPDRLFYETFEKFATGAAR